MAKRLTLRAVAKDLLDGPVPVAMAAAFVSPPIRRVMAEQIAEEVRLLERERRYDSAYGPYQHDLDVEALRRQCPLNSDDPAYEQVGCGAHWNSGVLDCSMAGICGGCVFQLPTIEEAFDQMYP